MDPESFEYQYNLIRFAVATHVIRASRENSKYTLEYCAKQLQKCCNALEKNDKEKKKAAREKEKERLEETVDPNDEIMEGESLEAQKENNYNELQKTNNLASSGSLAESGVFSQLSDQSQPLERTQSSSVESHTSQEVRIDIPVERNDIAPKPTSTAEIQLQVSQTLPTSSSSPQTEHHVPADQTTKKQKTKETTVKKPRQKRVDHVEELLVSTMSVSGGVEGDEDQMEAGMRLVDMFNNVEKFLLETTYRTLPRSLSIQQTLFNILPDYQRVFRQEVERKSPFPREVVIKLLPNFFKKVTLSWWKKKIQLDSRPWIHTREVLVQLVDGLTDFDLVMGVQRAVLEAYEEFLEWVTVQKRTKEDLAEIRRRVAFVANQSLIIQSSISTRFRQLANTFSFNT